MSIVVAGATGNLGSHAVDALIQRGVEPAGIVAAGRNPDRLAELATRGVRTARVDFDDPDSLRAAFDGAQKLLLVSVNGNDRRFPQHCNAVDAAKAAGVEQIVYTSWTHADTSTLHFEHYATEQALDASGVPHVVLRDPPYTEVYTSWIPLWREAGKIVGAAGDGRITSASYADLGAAAAAVLTSTGHEGAIYELGGESFTMSEFAAELSRQTGETIPYVNVSLDEYEAYLVSVGFHEYIAHHFADCDRVIASGEFINDSGDLHRLVGRPLTSLSDAITHALHSPAANPMTGKVRSSPEQPISL
jgi:NAD(P)H dehydrogenase (quinone)